MNTNHINTYCPVYTRTGEAVVDFLFAKHSLGVRFRAIACEGQTTGCESRVGEVS